jgi:hypothetical protein
MSLNNKQLYLLLFLSGALFFTSCKTSRQPLQIALTKKDKMERIESLQSQAIQYNTFSSPLHLSIKTGKKNKNTSLDAQLKIHRDQLIQFSLRIPFLGTEAGRITITPNQIIVIDRINKRYFSESMEKLRTLASFDFDFYSLQALLTNHLFIAGKPNFDNEDYNFLQLTENEFYITLKNTDSQGLNYDFESDYTDRILKTEMYKDKESATIKWLYTDFGLTSNRKLFPTKMNVELKTLNNLIIADLSFSTIDIDTDFKLDAEIPNRYDQIDFDQLIKLMQSL